MPVTLKLSDDEARDLAEMLSTAATVAASNQQDGAEGRLVAWGKLVSRLMEELSATPKLKPHCLRGRSGRVRLHPGI